uniref:Ribosomal protein S1 n=1 Tax=Polysiphonia sp. TaxID=1967842 RepID=A0A1Z1MTI2_9FLOR|nr:ribosomal protein S1 [Polysiphonia sp.]
MVKKKNQFAEILKKYQYQLHSGDIVAGTIIYNEKIGFLVDIGTDKSGYLPQEEVTLNNKNKNPRYLKLINMTRDFFIITENKKINQYILSIKRLEYIRAWKRIKQMYSESIVLEVQIKHINKGGIITYIEGIQAFIPKSHINNKLINNECILCKLLTINENKNQIILSHKSANLILSKHKFKIGELVYGKVTTLKPYGLFINLYNIKALLHTSEMCNIQINSYKTRVKNQKVIKVQIIHLDTENGKISLSIRNLKIINHHQQH